MPASDFVFMFEETQDFLRKILPDFVTAELSGSQTCYWDQLESVSILSSFLSV